MTKIAWRDSFMTWPTLQVQINILPWSWRLLPRGWYDYSPGAHCYPGWWGVTAEWLGVRVDFGINLPAFELMHVSEETEPPL